MLYSIWKKCCLCGCICDEWEYNPKIDNFICINCSETNEQSILNHMEDLLIDLVRCKNV